MSSDLDLLRQKKALELRRRLLLSQAKQVEQAQPQADEAKVNPRDTVRKILVGRGVEVMETARRRYHEEIGMLERKLAGLIENGRLKGPVSGEELYSFLRRLGLEFSMDTKIRIIEGGKLKSLEEKLRGSGKDS